jgi:hypothetical protein
MFKGRICFFFSPPRVLNILSVPVPRIIEQMNTSNTQKFLLESENGLSQEINLKSMASVAVAISCMGLLGGNQGLWPYPSGPSQLSIFPP